MFSIRHLTCHLKAHWYSPFHLDWHLTSQNGQYHFNPTEMNYSLRRPAMCSWGCTRDGRYDILSIWFNRRYSRHLVSSYGSHMAPRGENHKEGNLSQGRSIHGRPRPGSNTHDARSGSPKWWNHLVNAQGALLKGVRELATLPTGTTLPQYSMTSNQGNNTDIWSTKLGWGKWAYWEVELSCPDVLKHHISVKGVNQCLQ